MIAAGVETREDKGWRDPDTIVALGISNLNVAQPVRGAVEADEFYLELSLPLLTDVPLAQSLDLDLAWRYSDYETFDSSDNFKVGVNWQIFTDLKVRSTVSTAFRVPNVNELFGGIRTGQLNTIDPCSNWGLLDPSDVVSQNCQAVGLPVGFVYSDVTISTTHGGNPLLEPEEADTFTLGIVYQPSFLEGLALTVDYWDIEIEDAITTIDGTTTLALCYNSPGLSHPFCSPDTHTRNALIGDVDFLFAGRANTGLESINGIDFGLTYAFEIMDIPLTFQTKITFLDEYTVTPFAGADPIARDTTIGCCIGGYPEYRSYTSLKFGGNRWTGNYSIQTIGEAFGRSGNCPDAIGCNVDTVVYHNIQGSYEISENMDLAVGIDNLFDENPPYVINWSDANTDTMTYDLIGVRGYARLTYRWQ